jgi:hypothetical protein
METSPRSRNVRETSSTGVGVRKFREGSEGEHSLHQRYCHRCCTSQMRLCHPKCRLLHPGQAKSGKVRETSPTGVSVRKFREGSEGEHSLHTVNENQTGKVRETYPTGVGVRKFRESSRPLFQLTTCSVEGRHQGCNMRESARSSQIRKVHGNFSHRGRCEKVHGKFKASVSTYGLHHREEAIRDAYGEIQPEQVR